MTTAHLAIKVADYLWEFRPAREDDDSGGWDARTRLSIDASPTPDRSSVAGPRRTEHDQALLERLKTGDDRAWDDILRTYGSWLVGVAKTIVKSPDLAQDVVQDVFAWLWDRRDRLEVRGTIAPYLYRAVRNRAMDVRAHERVEESARDRVVLDQGGSQIESPAASIREMAALEFEQEVQRALSGLSPKLREVFLLRIDHGWSNAEIADALGIAVASVRKQMYRATTALAEWLTPWLESRE
jgi:RNA polymerase sigma-70 factor (ECF subfamily)